MKNGNFTNLYKNNSWQKKTINNDDLLAIKGIEEVKGNDINILDLRDIDTSVCDYFVICNGNSNTQVNAIVNSIQKTVSKELKDKPWHVEVQTMRNGCLWIMLT
jgi:ribosome-associated protein